MVCPGRTVRHDYLCLTVKIVKTENKIYKWKGKIKFGETKYTHNFKKIDSEKWLIEKSRVEKGINTI